MREGQGQSTDPVEQALLQARSHLDSAVLQFRSLPKPHFLELSGDSRQAPPGGATVELVAQARRVVLVVLSGMPGQLAAVRTALENLRGRYTTGPGRLAVRLLGTAAALRVLPAWVAGLAELRVVGCQLAEFLVVDGTVALTRVPDDASGDLLVRDRATVRVLSSLFAGAWEAALPWDGYPALDGCLSTDTARGVLHQLRQGATDAVAADELGMSLRTYRRHVARILRCLGVSARFSGGTRAAELQLFDMR